MLQWQKWVVVFLLALTAVTGTGLAGEKDVFLVSSELLDTIHLETQWQVNLPIKRKENVDRMFMFGRYLYVLSDHNYLVCLDRSKGRIRFGLQLATAGLPVTEPQYYEGDLWFIVGNEVLVLDELSGRIQERHRLEVIGRSAVCNIARNETHLFIAGASRRLNAIVLDGYWTQFIATADDNSMINSLVVANEWVIFTTQTGKVVRISSKEPVKKWTYDVGGEIWAPAVRDGGSVYVGSLNTKLYKLAVEDGRMEWKIPFQSGDKIFKPVDVGRDVVYLRTADMGVYGVDKMTGQSLWRVDEGLGLVAERGPEAFIFAQPGVLVVMNNQSKEHEFTVNFSEVTNFATNTADSVLYVGDDDGRVAALASKSK